MRRMDLFASLSLFMLAISLRLIPLTFSSQPYNIDGFPLVRLSEHYLAEGVWSLNSLPGSGYLLEYNNKLPAFPLLLAMFSSLTGLEPMKAIGIMVALISSITIVAVHSITLRITRSSYAALGAGLFLAFSGISVYLGAAAMKQVIAFPLIPLTAYLYATRADSRNRILAALLLLTFPVIHHLSTLIVFLIIGMIFIADQVKAYSIQEFCLKKLVLDLLLGPALLLVSIAYYNFSGMLDLNIGKLYSPMSPNTVALLGSVFFLFSMIAARAVVARSTRTRSPLLTPVFIVPIIGAGVLLLNMEMKMFSGTILTSASLVRSMIPYFLLLALGAIGGDILAFSSSRHRSFMLAMIFAPLSLMVYALAKGLDIPSFDLIYRTFGFLELGLALCVGIGLGHMIAWLSRTRLVADTPGGSTIVFRLRKMWIPTLALFCGLCIFITPMAFSMEELTGFKTVTTDQEFSALEFAGSLNGTLCTDQPFSHIAAPYFGSDTIGTLPLYLRDNGNISSCETFLIMNDWVRTGGQLYPFDPIKVPAAKLNGLVNSNNLVYHSGSGYDQIFLLLED